MGRVYKVNASAAMAAAGDILEILVPADAVMKLHQVIVAQSNKAGDAASEQLRWSISRVTGAPTSGSGGGTPTPTPVSPGDAAAGITVEAFNSTALTGGTETVLYDSSWNVMAGDNYLPIPDGQDEFSPGTRCMVKLLSTPASSTTMQVFAQFEELGG